jgi:hypothetical protein
MRSFEQAVLASENPASGAPLPTRLKQGGSETHRGAGTAIHDKMSGMHLTIAATLVARDLRQVDMTTNFMLIGH